MAHGREEVAPRLTRALLGLDLLLEKTILAPAQDVEEAYDYRERRDEQKQFDAHLREHVCADIPENAIHHARIDGLSDERTERRLGRVAYREADPHERREEDQDENADPDDDGVPEAREPVDEEHVPVLQEPGEAPDGENEIRLGRKRLARYVVRHEHQESEANRHRDACHAERLPDARGASGLLFGDGQRGGRGVAVRERGAEVRDVDGPSGDGASEKRNRERNARHEEHGVRGRAFAVETPEPARDRPAVRHRVHKPARGDQSAEDARQLRGEHRASDDGLPRGAEGPLRRGEYGHRVNATEVREVLDVFAPVRVSVRNRDDRQDGEQNVHRRGEHDRREEDAEGAADGEAELGGRVDYRLEADERPRDHGEDVDHLHEVPALWRERRPHRGEASLVARERCDEHRRDSCDEDPRENRVKPGGEPLAEQAHRAAERRRGDAYHDFAEVHLEPGHRVVEAELQRVAEEVSHQKDERSRVRPQDRDVGEPQEPREKESVVRPEHLRGEGVRAAGSSRALEHPVVVEREHGHRDRSDDDADDGSRRPRAREEHRPGHDERTPSHGIAEGQSKDSYRREIRAEFRLGGLFAATANRIHTLSL